MPDHTDLQLALRARLLTLSVCTTGVMTLEATLSGYQRASGSFLVDGFAVGMEVTPVGFSDSDRSVITSVSATVMTVDDPRTVDAPAGSRSLTVGLPELRAWDNTTLSPVAGKPYIEETFVPATASLLSSPLTGGVVEDTGLYIIRWYGKANTGLAALGDAVSAVLELFKPGTALTVADGTLRVRGDLGPWRGQMMADMPGWTVIVITIPWRLYSAN